MVSVTGWVNRFANAGDAAMEVAGNTALRVRCSSAILFFVHGQHYISTMSIFCNNQV